MKTLALLLFTLLPLEARAAKFNCEPIEAPKQQGDERFYKIEITSQAASIELADMAGPYVSLTQPFKLQNSFYSDTEVNASATWVQGRETAIELSLMYFGSWWGGNLRVNLEETDLRCKLLD